MSKPFSLDSCIFSSYIFSRILCIFLRVRVANNHVVTSHDCHLMKCSCFDLLLYNLAYRNQSTQNIDWSIKKEWVKHCYM